MEFLAGGAGDGSEVMSFCMLLAVSLTVAPVDRLSMADRLFNRGEIKAAEGEYLALKGDRTIEQDELLYRLGECAAARKDNKTARAQFKELITRYPNSTRVDYARLRSAQLAEGEERRMELKLLDGDQIESGVRAAALYFLGEMENDPETLERSYRLDPKGAYSDYARFSRAMIFSKRVEDRRKAVSLFIEIAFSSKLPLAEDALYLAATTSYSDKRYGEADSLLTRYLKKYPQGTKVKEALDLAVWCDYFGGKYADAFNRCGEGKSDDTAFVRALSAQRLGEKQKADELCRQYLANYPEGKYRKEVELIEARLQFGELAQSTNVTLRLAAARRVANMSRDPSDQLCLCWALEQAGMEAEAERKYQEIALHYAGSAEAAEAMYRKAFLEMKKKKWSAAELSLREALSGKLADSLRRDAEYWVGWTAIASGHAEEGCAKLKAALEHGLDLDRSREARLLIAAQDFNSGRTNEATTAYQTLIREGAAERIGAKELFQIACLMAPVEKKMCAQVLLKNDSVEWRQIAYALLGEAEEGLGNLAAASEARTQALAIPVVTELMPITALKQGEYLSAIGKYEAAEKALKRAVEISVQDNNLRARAYLGLAKNAIARKKSEEAKGYATIVTELFDNTESAKEARNMLQEMEARK